MGGRLKIFRACGRCKCKYTFLTHKNTINCEIRGGRLKPFLYLNFQIAGGRLKCDSGELVLTFVRRNAVFENGQLFCEFRCIVRLCGRAECTKSKVYKYLELGGLLGH